MNHIEREIADMRKRINDSIVERNEMRLQLQALQSDFESNFKTKKDSTINKRKKTNAKALQSTLFYSDEDLVVDAAVDKEISDSDVFRLTSDFTGVEIQNIEEIETLKKVKSLFDWCLSPIWAKCLKDLVDNQSSIENANLNRAQTINRVKNLIDLTLSPSWSKFIKEMIDSHVR